MVDDEIDEIVLNLGCGRNRIDGMVNVDLDMPGHKPDVVLDLNEATTDQWVGEFGRDSVDGAQLIHVIEHIPNHLQMMENLWHVLKPGGLVLVRCPHGASDDAWEDPTHVRPFFPNSFAYYAQPTYWRADYGYRGDFRVLDVVLLTQPESKLLINSAQSLKSMADQVSSERNCVLEMIVTLEAVKPIRDNNRDLMEPIKTQVRVAQGWQ